MLISANINPSWFRHPTTCQDKYELTRKAHFRVLRALVVRASRQKARRFSNQLNIFPPKHGPARKGAAHLFTSLQAKHSSLFPALLPNYSQPIHNLPRTKLQDRKSSLVQKDGE